MLSHVFRIITTAPDIPLVEGRHHGLKIKILTLIPFLYIWLHLQSIPYRMEMYTEFNLATWLRLVKINK